MKNIILSFLAILLCFAGFTFCFIGVVTENFSNFNGHVDVLNDNSIMSTIWAFVAIIPGILLCLSVKSFAQSVRAM